MTRPTGFTVSCFPLPIARVDEPLQWTDIGYRSGTTRVPGSTPDGPTSPVERRIEQTDWAAAAPAEAHAA